MSKNVKMAAQIPINFMGKKTRFTQIRFQSSCPIMWENRIKNSPNIQKLLMRAFNILH